MATNDSGSGGKRREVEEERMEKSVRKDRVRDRDSLPLDRSITAILSRRHSAISVSAVSRDLRKQMFKGFC